MASSVGFRSGPDPAYESGQCQLWTTADVRPWEL